MKTFADIAPAVERVDIRGEVFELRGLSFGKLCELTIQFPAVVSLLTGQLDAAALLVEAPSAAASLVAYAMGRGEDEALKASFNDNLVLGEQVELVTAAIRASKPKGDGPFVELQRVMGYRNSGENLASPSPASSSSTASVTAT